MKKGTKILLIVLVIILICGAGVCGWYLGTKYAKKEDTKKVEEKEEETKKEKEKNEDSNEGKDPDDEKTTGEELPALSFPLTMCGRVDFEFQEKTVYAKDISDDDKLAMLAGVLLEFNAKEVPNIDYYDEEGFELDFDIKEVAKKYFDITPSMEKKINEGFGNESSSFVSKNNKSYYYFLPGGCEGPGNDGHGLKYIGKKKDGHTLIKSYYYYYTVVSDEFVEEKQDDGTILTYSPESIYKNKNDKKPVYKDVKETDNLDFSNFNTYDIYFDTTGGNMKLTKIVFNKK